MCLLPMSIFQLGKLYQCTQCSKSYTSRNLKRHLNTVHLKMKKFKCVHCGKAFGYDWYRKRHEREFCPKVDRPGRKAAELRVD